MSGVLFGNMPASDRTFTEYTVRDQERMRHAKRYFRWQYRVAVAQLGNRILEVGCGLGNFTRLLLDREFIVAIDVEAECVRQLQGAFPGQANLVALHMDALDPSFPALKRYAVDSIVCLNVLEHIQDDGLVLSNFHSVLPPGGRVVLIVPAFGSLYGPIDTNLGHYRRYSKKSLTAVAASSGFRPDIMRYVNSIGFVGWWLNAHVFKKDRQSEFQIAVFDSLLVPVLSRLEGLVDTPLWAVHFCCLGQKILTR